MPCRSEGAPLHSSGGGFPESIEAPTAPSFPIAQANPCPVPASSINCGWPAERPPSVTPPSRRGASRPTLYATRPRCICSSPGSTSPVIALWLGHEGHSHDPSVRRSRPGHEGGCTPAGSPGSTAPCGARPVFPELIISAPKVCMRVAARVAARAVETPKSRSMSRRVRRVRSSFSSWLMASGMARSHRGLGGTSDPGQPVAPVQVGTISSAYVFRQVSRRFYIMKDPGPFLPGSHKGGYGTVRKSESNQSRQGGSPRAKTGGPEPVALAEPGRDPAGDAARAHPAGRRLIMDRSLEFPRSPVAEM